MAPIDQTAKSAYWVLVADEFQARIFSRQKKFSALAELSRFENPVARMKTGEVMADRGGRSFDSGGQGRHSMDSDKANPKTESYPAFAKELARALAKGQQHKKFARLIVVAAPRFPRRFEARAENRPASRRKRRSTKPSPGRTPRRSRRSSTRTDRFRARGAVLIPGGKLDLFLVDLRGRLHGGQRIAEVDVLLGRRALAAQHPVDGVGHDQQDMNNRPCTQRGWPGR